MTEIRSHIPEWISRTGFAVKLLMYSIIFSAAIPCYALNSISSGVAQIDDGSPVITSISLQLGILNGISKELIYSKNEKISEIDWELQPLYFTGLELNTRFFRKFNLNFGFWTGINKNTGKVNNYDYANSTLSGFSQQHNTVERFRIFDSNASYTYRISNDLSLSGILGYNYMNLKMLAHDGYIQYTMGSAAKPFYGTGIMLEQTIYIPYIGLGVTYIFEWPVYLQFVSLYSPYVSSNETDYHVQRRIEIYSTIKSGSYISIICSAGWKFSSDTLLILTSEYTEIETARGSSYTMNVLTGVKSPGFSETSSLFFTDISIRISAEHSFSWIE